MPKRLYYCMVWQHMCEEPMTKFIYADSVRDLVDEFLNYGYISVSITDITDMEVGNLDM